MEKLKIQITVTPLRGGDEEVELSMPNEFELGQKLNEVIDKVNELEQALKGE